MPLTGASLDLLYQASARGQLARYLDQNAGELTDDVVQRVQDDFRRAVEFGDLHSANVAANLAADVLVWLGRSQEALATRVELLMVQVDAASSVQEFESVRMLAVGLGAQSQDVGSPTLLADCWMALVEAGFELAEASAGTRQDQYLSDALRDLADLVELVAVRGPRLVPADQLRSVAFCTGRVIGSVYERDWAEPDLLRMRTLIRRVARAAERVITRDVVRDVHPDQRQVRAIEATLVALFSDDFLE